MSLAGVDMERRYGSGWREWVKTPTGWVLPTQGPQPLEDDTRNDRVSFKQLRSTRNNKEAKIYRQIIVRGTRGQRHVPFLCLSEVLKILDLQQAATETRRSAYAYEVLFLLIKDYLNKVSGSAHRQLFQMLEIITVHAMETELHIDRVKNLLVVALKSLIDLGSNRVGCSSLWNKHVQAVTNLSSKLEQFQLTPREEDEKPLFTDLPKECIRDIMLRLSDHRDILHLGQCNIDLYDMSLDLSIWERLAQYHFSEKQMLNFICEEDLGEGTDWCNVYKKCYKKYGLKKTYADMIVLCTKCKVLHWMMNGHDCCGSEDELVDLEPIMPAEFLSILNL